MLMFSNGCSFLAMRPKDNVMTFTSKILAEDYGMDLVNLAMGGRGNSRISFTTKHWLEKFYKKDTFALIGWSSYFRNDYVTDDGWKKGRIAGTDTTWRTWKTLDNVTFIRQKQGWDIENHATMNFLDNIFDLQNYFERNRIPYVMYNALPNNLNVDVHDFNVIKNSLNMKRFFRPDISHYEYVLDRKLIVSPNDPHPSLEGHQQWADMLFEFAKSNNLFEIN